MQKTPEEIKKGLECRKQGYAEQRGYDCSKCDVYVPGYLIWDLLNDALTYIQQLERERDAAMPKWISVEKRLPKAGKFVLLKYAKNAQNPTLHARNTMAVGRYEYGMFLVEGCSVKVTHWMPLPVPPKEKER